MLLNPANRAQSSTAPLVYSELKRIARHHLRTFPPRPTLCTTELIHEAFMKIAAGANLDGKTARTFRRGFARDAASIGLTDDHATMQVQLDEVLALDQALDRLGLIDARLRQIVEYRFFGGPSEEEIARLLGVST